MVFITATTIPMNVFIGYQPEADRDNETDGGCFCDDSLWF
jgi:hypothetical protein